jgi:hypothetical protein
MRLDTTRGSANEPARALLPSPLVAAVTAGAEITVVEDDEQQPRTGVLLLDVAVG